MISQYYWQSLEVSLATNAAVWASNPQVAGFSLAGAAVKPGEKNFRTFTMSGHGREKVMEMTIRLTSSDGKVQFKDIFGRSKEKGDKVKDVDIIAQEECIVVEQRFLILRSGWLPLFQNLAEPCGSHMNCSHGSKSFMGLEVHGICHDIEKGNLLTIHICGAHCHLGLSGPG